jgi:hypothetical protein
VPAAACPENPCPWTPNILTPIPLENRIIPGSLLARAGRGMSGKLPLFWDSQYSKTTSSQLQGGPGLVCALLAAACPCPENPCSGTPKYSKLLLKYRVVLASLLARPGRGMSGKPLFWHLKYSNTPLSQTQGNTWVAFGLPPRRVRKTPVLAP